MIREQTSELRQARQELALDRKELREDRQKFELRIQRLRSVYTIAWDVVIAYGKAPEIAASDVQKLQAALVAAEHFWES